MSWKRIIAFVSLCWALAIIYAMFYIAIFGENDVHGDPFDRTDAFIAGHVDMVVLVLAVTLVFRVFKKGED